jgi:hypothetical protein
LVLEQRTISRPSEVLLLSPRGEMMIRTQLMDWPIWEEFKGLVSAPAAAAPAAGGGQPPGPAPAGGRPDPFQLK